MELNLFELFKRKKVILRNQKDDRIYRYLGARIKENGDLLIEGQDLGSGVEDAFGCAEYEWYWTIKVKDLHLFNQALGFSGNILCLLKIYFSNENAVELYQFMKKNNIPFDSYSRIGD